MGWQEHEEIEESWKREKMRLIEEPITPTALNNHEAAEFARNCQTLTSEINSTLKAEWRKSKTPTIKFNKSCFEEHVVGAVRSEFEKSWTIKVLASPATEIRWEFSAK